MDLHILEKVKKGDKETFGEVIEYYYRDAYLFALSITGNTHDAMDVCQDSFLKAFKNLNKLRENEKFKSWMMTIVANTAKDTYRKNKPKQFDTNELYEVFSDSSLEDKLDLFKALMQIKPDYRKVLVLKYLNDLKISDIARILKVPQNTVKSRLRYALDQMRVAMGGGENENN